jgi:hypothetical protein
MIDFSFEKRKNFPFNPINKRVEQRLDREREKEKVRCICASNEKCDYEFCAWRYI